MTRGLGIIHMILSGLLIVLGLTTLLVVTWNGAGPGNPGALVAFWIGYGLIVLLFLAPSFVGGLGLVRGQRWARGLIMVLSGILLFAFPIGTLLGGYGLWVLFTDDPNPPIPLGTQPPGLRSNVPTSSS